MFTKEVTGKVIGIKNYTNTTKEGKQYTTKYYVIIYEDKNNKNLEGYNAEVLKSNVPLTAGEYAFTICTIKSNDKYYSEIVSAKYIEKEKKNE